MKPMLMTFGFDAAENSLLRGICAAENLQMKAVPPEEYGLPMGAHVGMLPKMKLDEGSAASGQMLLFAFADDPSIGAVLRALREKQVGVASYKAVLTPNNMFWSASQLLEELKKEREELGDNPK